MTNTKDYNEPKNDLCQKNSNTHNNEDINTINTIKSEKYGINVHYTKDRLESPVEKVKFVGLGSNSSIYSDESEEDKLPPVPDGGWGWVVVIAAFGVSACSDGLAFSFGLLHEEFTTYFGTTQSKTSLIGSIFMATPLLAGPVMSALVNRYGCRVMTMIAGVVSTIGFLLASVSNSVEMLCLTFGFISGLAMGIFYVTAVVAVAFWFDKRRNLAVSLASCGIGFGTLIYSPMTYYLLEMYHWRHAIVLLAGTLLNMCVCGALMRDPKWLKVKKRKLKASGSKWSSSACSVSSKSISRAGSAYLDAEELKLLLKSGKSPEYILATLSTNIAVAAELEAATQMNADKTCKRMQSTIQLPTFVQQNEKVPPEVTEKMMVNNWLYNILSQNYTDILMRRHSDTKINVEIYDHKQEPPKLPIEIKANETKNEKKSEDKTQSAEKYMHNKQTLMPNTNLNSIKTKEKLIGKSSLPGLIHNKSWLRRKSNDHFNFGVMSLYRNSMMQRGGMLSIPPRYKLKASSLPNIYKNSSSESDSDEDRTWTHRIWQTLKATFDFEMFTEFHFLMFNLSSLILSVWYIAPYFFLTSYMKEMHIEGAELMICIIGVASSIGIVSLGWAGDQPWINLTKTYTVCLIICGLSIAAYPIFITNYWALTVVSAIFGLSFASSYSYIPAILIELMPMDRFTVAYGLILLSMGIGHLVGPPIGGMLYDLTKSWDLTFYMGGAWVIVSGLCVGVIAYTKNVRVCSTTPLLKDLEKTKKDIEVNI